MRYPASLCFAINGEKRMFKSPREAKDFLSKNLSACFDGYLMTLHAAPAAGMDTLSLQAEHWLPKLQRLCGRETSLIKDFLNWIGTIYHSPTYIRLLFDSSHEM